MTPPDRPAAVLFACTWNRVRSPMAAALLRAGWPAVWADSCGVQAKGAEAAEPDPFVEAVLAEIDAPLSPHAPKGFAEVGDGSFDLLVALSSDAGPAAERFARGRAMAVELWPVSDPTEAGGSRDQRLLAYRAVRDDLRRRLAAKLGPPESAA